MKQYYSLIFIITLGLEFNSLNSIAQSRYPYKIILKEKPNWSEKTEFTGVIIDMSVSTITIDIKGEGEYEFSKGAVKEIYLIPTYYKGWYLISESGVLGNLNINIPVYPGFILCSLMPAYQITRKCALGLGGRYEYFAKYYVENGDSNIYKISSIPVYMDVRYYFLENKASPFIFSQVGIAWGGGGEFPIARNGSFFSSLGFGYRSYFADKWAMHFICGYKLQSPQNPLEYFLYDNSISNNIDFKIGISFFTNKY